mmetsp:Transcript_35978/g.85762  ORF Transcript_35978/g.85762 Transcript_35978/m.85762 type:complete len:337 (+) Transcript_35978:224-1234(+)
MRRTGMGVNLGVATIVEQTRVVRVGPDPPTPCVTARLHHHVVLVPVGRVQRHADLRYSRLEHVLEDGVPVQREYPVTFGVEGRVSKVWYRVDEAVCYKPHREGVVHRRNPPREGEACVHPECRLTLSRDNHGVECTATSAPGAVVALIDHGLHLVNQRGDGRLKRVRHGLCGHRRHELPVPLLILHRPQQIVGLVGVQAVDQDLGVGRYPNFLLVVVVAAAEPRLEHLGRHRARLLCLPEAQKGLGDVPREREVGTPSIRQRNGVASRRDGHVEGPPEGVSEFLDHHHASSGECPSVLRYHDTADSADRQSGQSRQSPTGLGPGKAAFHSQPDDIP